MTVPFEPIRIIELIKGEVTRPRNDGSSGSALYAVPFRFSRQPPSDWSELFIHNWDHPSQFSSMHRSGIARITGDKLILDGTTMEEVEKTHQHTLKIIVDDTNRRYAEATAQQQADDVAKRERDRVAAEEHKRDVEERAKRIKFDQ